MRLVFTVSEGQIGKKCDITKSCIVEIELYQDNNSLDTTCKSYNHKIQEKCNDI
jgi:hypothetical protein